MAADRERGCAAARQAATSRRAPSAFVILARRWPARRPAASSIARPAGELMRRRRAAAPHRAPPDRAPLRRSSRPDAIARRDGREHRSRIQLLHDAHDRHAGLGVARDHRAMHGRGAAPSRQQRRVNVDHAEAGNPQQRVGQELAVGRDDAEVGRQRANRARGTLRPAGAPAAGPGTPRASASSFVGVGCEMVAAPLRPVRLRDERDDVVTRSRAGARSVGTANSGVPK